MSYQIVWRDEKGEIVKVDPFEYRNSSEAWDVVSQDRLAYNPKFAASVEPCHEVKK